MFSSDLDKIVAFASQGPLGEELKRARGEFVARTGDMFESDPSFERRVSSFLEWYVLDRPVAEAQNKTPARLYIDSVAADMTTPELTQLRYLTKTTLSLFEFRRAKADSLLVHDLVADTKLEIFERRKPAGLESGDLLEARLVPHHDTLMFSGTFGFHPREVRKAILKAAKALRKDRPDDARRIDFVHRVAYFSNRCERYRHVDPREIFSDLAA